MGEFFKRWRLTVELVGLFLVFAAGYGVGHALAPRRPQFHEIYLPKDEYDALQWKQHEERITEIQSLRATMQEEREEWRDDRKLFSEAGDCHNVLKRVSPTVVS
jgi:hypothetical protein